MNKGELVEQVADVADLSRAGAEAAVTAVTDAITEALKAGDSVSLVGFGSFQVKQRAARIGRNPQTGAELKIAACNVPSFKAGKALKEAVN